MSPLKKTALAAIRRIAVPLAAIAGAGRRHRDRLAPPTTRAAFVATVPIDDALEIGPFANPVIRGGGVAYFDVLDTAALHARATAIGYRPDQIPAIDYVSPVGDLAVVDRAFPLILSSHAIEHQPDLVAHLNGVERILSAGGCYALIVPDRRYSFDHFLPESTLAEVEAAHRSGRRVHTRRAVLDHRLGTTHNNPLRHWLGLHGRPAPDRALRDAAEAEAQLADAGTYVDVHAWTFSPASFRRILDGLRAAGLTTLVADVVHDTAFGDLEFFAVLRKPA